MPRFLAVLFATVAAVSLAACSEKEGNGSLSIDMNSEADAGNVSISVPGIDARLNVPTGIMNAGDFDMDGVELYPGAKMTTFNLHVDETDNGAEPRQKPIVKLSFAAPADVPTVTAWYKEQFAQKSVKVTQSPAGFTGTTEDGDTFTLALAAGAPGQTRGTIDVIEAGK